MRITKKPGQQVSATTADKTKPKPKAKTKSTRASDSLKTARGKNKFNAVEMTRSKNGGAVQAALAQETDAIAAYIGKNWDVQHTGGKKAVRAIIEQALERGYEHGLGWAQDHHFAHSQTFHESIVDMANLLLGESKFVPVQAEPLPRADFDALTAWFDEVERKGLTAKPKPEAKRAQGFAGQPLVSALGATVPSFADNLTPSVRYHKERDRSPVNTLLGSICRQGMNIAYRVTENASPFAQREREIAKAVGLEPMTGMALVNALLLKRKEASSGAAPQKPRR